MPVVGLLFIFCGIWYFSGHDAYWATFTVGCVLLISAFCIKDSENGDV